VHPGREDRSHAGRPPKCGPGSRTPRGNPRTAIQRTASSGGTSTGHPSATLMKSATSGCTDGSAVPAWHAGAGSAEGPFETDGTSHRMPFEQAVSPQMTTTTIDTWVPLPPTETDEHTQEPHDHTHDQCVECLQGVPCLESFGKLGEPSGRRLSHLNLRGH